MEFFWFSPLESESNLILWCAFAGCLAGILYTALLRGGTKRFLNALLQQNCTAVDTAKSPAALGVKAKAAARAEKGALRGVLAVTGEGEEKRYYIPEEKRAKAEYAAGLKWNPWLALAAAAGLYLAMCLIHAALAAMFS